MTDLKYFTIDQLEKFIGQLREEIEYIEGGGMYMTTGDMDDTSIPYRTLQQSKEMLRHAEAEILERTLLGKPNEV